jgi:ketosteroid isomerase-like protein
LTSAQLETWLQAYGSAWEAKDGDAVRAIFAADARYYETPYAEPFRGRGEIRDYWSRVTGDQRDIKFEATVVSIAANTGVARWSAKFESVSGKVPVELNGVFVLQFDAQGRCAELREWWHAR